MFETAPAKHYTHKQGLQSTCRRRLHCGPEQAGAKLSPGGPDRLVGSGEELGEPRRDDQDQAKVIGVQVELFNKAGAKETSSKKGFTKLLCRI